VLLVGDAASLINPLTGEGIYYALVSGRIAGTAAVGAPTNPLGAYRAGMRAALGNHLRTTDVLARAAQSSRFIDAAIGTAARHDDVFDLLVDVGLGSGTVPLPLAYTVVRTWIRGGR
jgi:flavin-dependent dehydrogenase